MYKIIIVDDEQIFREYLRTVFEWETYDFEIISEAKNGIEALDNIAKRTPDIALIDINMPFMDGLELTKKIRVSYPDIAIVLITGHSEFEYAQKAVRLGIVEYILKPFDKEELLGTLMKIKERILKIRNEKKDAKDNQLIMKDWLLNHLLNQEFETLDKTIKEKIEKFLIDTKDSPFTVSTIEIDNLHKRWVDVKDISLWKFVVSNILSEIVKVKGAHYILNGPDGRVISIIEFIHEKEQEEFNHKVFQRMCNQVKRYFDFTITIGVGRSCKGVMNIRNSYLESITALQNKLVFGNGIVIKYVNVETEKLNVSFYSREKNEKILKSLRFGQVDSLRKELEDIFIGIKSKRLSKDYTIGIVLGLVSLCLSYITERGYKIENVYGENFSPYSEIKEKYSFEMIRNWVFDIFEKALKYTNKEKLTKSKKITKKALEYIEMHYNNNELNLEKIAENVFVNSSYLRRVFRNELNKTVIEHIIDLRMKHAKELITSSNIKLSDIAQLVGYSDSSYFSKCFKKYYGVTPSEFENINK